MQQLGSELIAASEDTSRLDGGLFFGGKLRCEDNPGKKIPCR